MFVVFDLDGTLADCEHRVHHIEGDNKSSEKNWDAFYDACSDDSPIIATLSVMRALIKAGHDIAIWTGRSDRVRKDTLQWLGRNLGPPATEIELVMRRAGDFTSDIELKRKWMNDYGKPELVFEDRESVVEMWREEGVRCFQVAPGKF